MFIWLIKEGNGISKWYTVSFKTICKHFFFKMAISNFLWWQPPPPHPLAFDSLPKLRAWYPQLFSSKWLRRVSDRSPRWLGSLSSWFCGNRENPRVDGNPPGKTKVKFQILVQCISFPKCFFFSWKMVGSENYCSKIFSRPWSSWRKRKQMRRLKQKYMLVKWHMSYIDSGNKVWWWNIREPMYLKANCPWNYKNWHWNVSRSSGF